MATKLLPGGVGLAAAMITAAVTLWGCPPQGVVCTQGLTPCGNKTCEDLQNDKRNCGACGVACQLGQVCQAGACVCAEGATDCNGACVVTTTNPQHCGDCATACTANQVCEAGKCKDTCLNGAQCGQSCVDLSADPNNCGACGAVCDQGQSCHGGICAADVVAACFTNGQVRGIQNGTFVLGPLKAFGSGPQSLAVFGSELLLSADGTDNRLYQGRLGDLSQLPTSTNLGPAPNQVFVDGDFVYVVQSAAGTLTIFKGAGGASDGGVDAGIADAGEMDAGVTDAGAEMDAGTMDAGETDGGGVSDAGLWSGGGDPLDVPAKFPNGVSLSLVKEINFGMNSFPQIAVKVGSHVYVTLYGGFTAATVAAGQKVADVDVSDPANASFTTLADLSTLPLETFTDGGGAIPRPQGITARNGVLYVALNNLDVNYNVAGPGYVATVPTDGGAAGLIKLPEDKCRNAVSTGVAGDKVLVSCAGQSDFSMFPTVTTAQTGVAMIDSSNAVVSAVSVACPSGGDGGCASPSLGRFSVAGTDVFVADQAAGRLFVFELSGNTLVEKKTYAAGQQPLEVCPVGGVGYSNVGDVLAVP